MSSIEFGWPIQLGLDVANIVIFFLTLASVVISFYAFIGIRAKEREAEKDEQRRFVEELRAGREAVILSNAKADYLAYLKLSFQNPAMSLGKYDASSPESEAQYDTYLSIMLMALDGLVRVEPEEWRDSMKYQLSLHKAYIREILHKSLSPDKSFRQGYHPILLEIVDEMFDEETVNEQL